MASSGYTFTTLHNDGVHVAPLPVRERTYGGAAGSAVVQADWGFLLDAANARCSRYGAFEDIDVYPHGVKDGSRMYPHATWFENIYQTALQGRFADPEAQPPEFYFSGKIYPGSWTTPPFSRSVGGTNLPFISPGIKRPRSLDSLRRAFYDVKRTKRWICTAPHEYLDDFGTWRQQSAYYSRVRGQPPSTFNPSDDRRSPSALVNAFSPKVLESAGWSIAPAYAGLQMDLQIIQDEGGLPITLTCFGSATMDANGKVGRRYLDSFLCNIVALECASSWGVSLDSCWFFDATIRVVAELYDCTFPLDSTLNSWTWEPDDGAQ